jgi:hypothetical protein
MQFHHEAITFADKRMMKIKSRPNAPFNYFLSLCHTWHKEHNVIVNYNLVEEIQKKYGISKSDLKLNSNERNPNITLDLTQQSTTYSFPAKNNTEFTRKQVVMHHENTHTDEEYRKVREYHQKMRPQDYVTTFNGEFEPKPPRLTLEEEVELPIERREQIIAKLDADWESTKGDAFKNLVGMKVALALYGRLRMQLSSGKIWPGPLPVNNPEKQPLSGQNYPEKQPF